MSWLGTQTASPSSTRTHHSATRHELYGVRAHTSACPAPADTCSACSSSSHNTFISSMTWTCRCHATRMTCSCCSSASRSHVVCLITKLPCSSSISFPLYNHKRAIRSTQNSIATEATMGNSCGPWAAEYMELAGHLVAQCHCCHHAEVTWQNYSRLSDRRRRY